MPSRLNDELVVAERKLKYLKRKSSPMFAAMFVPQIKELVESGHAPESAHADGLNTYTYNSGYPGHFRSEHLFAMQRVSRLKNRLWG